MFSEPVDILSNIFHCTLYEELSGVNSYSPVDLIKLDKNILLILYDRIEMNKAEICKKACDPLASNFLCYNSGTTVILKRPRVPKKPKLRGCYLFKSLPSGISFRNQFYYVIVTLCICIHTICFLFWSTHFIPEPPCRTKWSPHEFRWNDVNIGGGIKNLADLEMRGHRVEHCLGLQSRTGKLRPQMI